MVAHNHLAAAETLGGHTRDEGNRAAVAEIKATRERRRGHLGLLETSEHQGGQATQQDSHGQTGRSAHKIDVPGVVRILKGRVRSELGDVGAQLDVLLVEDAESLVLGVDDVFEEGVLVVLANETGRGDRLSIIFRL